MIKWSNAAQNQNRERSDRPKTQVT